MLGKCKGYSKKGEKVIKVNEGRLTAPTITTTLLTSTDPRDKPLTVNFRNQTNSQYDFRRFIVLCLKLNVLRRGDYLIMDNAKIHHAVDTFAGIRIGLRRRGIKILFMPTYSPELDPCELVFSQVKKHIRQTWMRDNLHFEDTIKNGFNLVKRTNMENYYDHCRNLRGVTI